MYCSTEVWSVRLGVRTPGFHPGNGGSIPPRTAEKKGVPTETPFFVDIKNNNYLLKPECVKNSFLSRKDFYVK